MEPSEFIEAALAAGRYSFDIEHPPDLSWWQEGFRLSGVSFATEGACFYETDMENVRKICKTLFEHPFIEAIAYNGKYDMKCLKTAGILDIYPDNFCDPMVAVNLLDDNRTPSNLGLKTVVFDVFDHTMVKFKDAWESGENSDAFANYAKEDAEWELRLWDYVRPKLIAQKLDNLFFKILMPVSKVFSDMEMTGIGWDLLGARKLLRGFQKLRESSESDIREVVGNINLNSGDQLARALFDDLGYSRKGIHLTASGSRTAVDRKAMTKLAKKYPVCEKIKIYRTSTKMINTYVEPLSRLALDDPNGRVHPTFWIVSATGRTRSEKPNFQNIPAFMDDLFKDLNIRKNVIPKKGNRLIVADLSQVELRLCAHITQDRNFLKAFTDWKCRSCGEIGVSTTILHHCPKCGEFENESAGFWHGLDLHQQTTDLVPALGGNRQYGKMANFALIYGASAKRMFAEYPDLSLGGWQDVIDQFMQQYQGIHLWHLRMQRQLYDSGECRDVFGRKRRITKQSIARNFKHALNQLVNFPVQSSACALIELSMVKMREHWIDSGEWLTQVFPTNFVHDEIVIECPESKVNDIIPVVENIMETTVDFRVPIRTDIAVVDRWGDAK
jgi:DNA polymerase-1